MALYRSQTLCDKYDYTVLIFSNLSLFINFVCGGYAVFTSVCPCMSPSLTFCFSNILKSHSWIFIKPCKHVHICKTNTLKKIKGKGPILLELFPFVVLNGFLYRVLCLCYCSPYTGRSTPATAFDGTI